MQAVDDLCHEFHERVPPAVAFSPSAGPRCADHRFRRYMIVNL
jgi:hypothetical protein